MRRKSEAGQALAVTVVAMVALIGFAGLGVDMGMLRYEKRLQQNAADAAAIAGANDLAFPSSGGVVAAAQNASAQNGFVDNGGGQVSDCGSGAAVGTVCVQVKNPPLSGPHTSGPGAANYVEVLVASVQPTYFMRILGINSEGVTARAVAWSQGSGSNNGCVYTLGSSPFGILGNGSLQAQNCSIMDNGTLDAGVNVLNALSVGVSGLLGNGTPATADPFSQLTPLCPSPCVGGTPINIPNSGTFSENPGTYSSISITGATTGNGPTVTFSPGSYIITGGFSITGNATISGTGVTFYFTNGATINASGGGSLLDFQLAAPTSGPYAGILFFQDPNDTSPPLLGGDNSSQFGGVLYFPKAALTLLASSTIGVIDAQSLTLSGSPTINLQGLPLGTNTVKQVATLVE